jgi:hypothetical protein
MYFASYNIFLTKVNKMLKNKHIVAVAKMVFFKYSFTKYFEWQKHHNPQGHTVTIRYRNAAQHLLTIPAHT